jgi:hypothetical protein
MTNYDFLFVNKKKELKSFKSSHIILKNHGNYSFLNVKVISEIFVVSLKVCKTLRKKFNI